MEVLANKNENVSIKLRFSVEVSSTSIKEIINLHFPYIKKNVNKYEIIWNKHTLLPII